MNSLRDAHLIDDFKFVECKKHPKITFKTGERWHFVCYSMSPRTDNQTKIVSRNIRRILKGTSRV